MFFFLFQKLLVRQGDINILFEGIQALTGYMHLMWIYLITDGKKTNIDIH